MLLLDCDKFSNAECRMCRSSTIFRTVECDRSFVRSVFSLISYISCFIACMISYHLSPNRDLLFFWSINIDCFFLIYGAYMYVHKPSHPVSLCFPPYAQIISKLTLLSRCQKLHPKYRFWNILPVLVLQMKSNVKISVGELKIYRCVPILGIDIKIKWYKTDIPRNFHFERDSLWDPNEKWGFF